MSTETIDEKPAAQVEHRWWLFTACVLTSLTNELSTAVTNLSLGPMRRDLGTSSAVMQMAVTLGKLMLGAFMLAGGVAGDVYGRRRVLVLGALAMVGASLLAAVAQTGGMLLVARALDGLASVAIGSMALALIASAFSQAEQARVIGLFLGLSGLGAALGPLGAGLVVEAQGWRAGFLMPAAVAVLGGFGVFLFAGGNGAKTEGRRLDGIGALTCAAGLLGLVFGVIQINHLGLMHPRVLESLAVGIGALLAFVWWERRAKDPLLDVTLFRNRTVSGKKKWVERFHRPLNYTELSRPPPYLGTCCASRAWRKRLVASTASRPSRTRSRIFKAELLQDLLQNRDANTRRRCLRKY